MREMKDSGVEWIGEIPSNWKLAKVRYLFRIGRGRVIAQTELKEKGKYPVYSSQTKDNGCLGYIDTFDFDVDQITWTTDGANAGTIFYRQGKHNCTNVCGTLQPLYKFIDLRYQKYALEHIAFYHKRADTNGFKIMNNEMAAIHTLIPPVDTQHLIADYLDSKCSKIDAIIEREQTVIEKLKEYKQSVITESVTKGLNPNTKMKNSGLDWIEEIPLTWDVLFLKQCIQTAKGNAFKSDLFTESGIPIVRVSEIKDGTVIEPEMHVESMIDEYNKVVLHSGEILMTTVGSHPRVTNSAVGQLARVPENLERALLNQNAVCLRNTALCVKEYLYYALLIKRYREHLNLIAHGTANQYSISLVEVLNFKMPFPKEKEQREIVSYLDRKCSMIDDNIIRKKSVIDKLTEYKKSLIYEVVTGKKEV